MCDPSDGTCSCDNCFSGPTCATTNTCSGRGSCSPSTGQCTCSDKCYSGSDCSAPNTCAGHGTCSAGACSCRSPNYDPATSCAQCNKCFSGPANNCGLPTIDCGAHGACVPATGACACTPPYTGAACDQGGPAPAGANGGAIAAAIILPTLALGAAAGLIYWQRANPGRSLASLLPGFGGGVQSYSSLVYKSDPTSPSASLARSSFLAAKSPGGLAASGGGGSGYGGYGTH